MIETLRDDAKARHKQGSELCVAVGFEVRLTGSSLLSVRYASALRAKEDLDFQAVFNKKMVHDFCSTIACVLLHSLSH